MSDVAPSLECVPGKYNAGLLFSQLPMDGSGDFTVTRTTTPTAGQATRVNAAGLIELVADNVPRLDYPLGGITAGCPALLVEPSATNLALQSEAFNTTWNNASNNLSISTNVSSTLDPAGGNTADLLTVVSGSTQSELSQLITVVSGTSYVFSIFGKKGSGATDLNSFRVLAPGNINTVTINWDTGVLTQTGSSGATSQNYGNGWWRIIIPFTASSTSVIIQAVTYVTYTAGISSLRWGAQLEVGSVPTSYIPTTTQAIARGADVITRTSASALIGQTEGTLYLEMQADAAGNGTAILTLGGASSDNYLYAGKDAAVLRIRVRIGGADVINNGATVLNGSVLKVAVAYQQSGSCAAYVNGNFLASGTAANNFTAALTGLGFGDQVTFPITTISAINRIRAAALYPTRRSNVDLVNMTAPDGSFLWGVNAPIRLWGTATNEIWG